MNDATSLLGTIAQSSAAIVAIIGGFLVSRLVAISSEREAIKRQLKAAEQERDHLQHDWQPVHEYRLQNSVRTLEEWLEEDLVYERQRTKDMPIEEVISRVPRASSFEEMLPYAKKFRKRVEQAFVDIVGVLSDSDTKSIDLDDLKRRGLEVPQNNEGLYDSVFSVIHRELPSPYTPSPFGGVTPDLITDMSGFKPAWSHEIDMRRLDESIREESQLRSQLDGAEQEVKRLSHDLTVFAQPVGVIAAIAILSLFSLLGVVAPLAVMAFWPRQIDTWVVAILFGSFVTGLGAVLAYIAWYFRRVRR